MFAFVLAFSLFSCSSSDKGGEDGKIKIGDRPGLGIELNEEECLKHPYVEHNLRHYTGALTDIRPAKTAFYF